MTTITAAWMAAPQLMPASPPGAPVNQHARLLLAFGTGLIHSLS
jgi:hypothetical protein